MEGMERQGRGKKERTGKGEIARQGKGLGKWKRKGP